MIRTQSQVIKTHDQLEKTIKQFVAGGVAGMCSRTVVAPIDRVKILMQTEKVTSGGSVPKYTGTLQAIRTIVAEGGITALWRSNTANIVRVAPYSATQFASYDLFKEFLTVHDPYNSKAFGVLERLTCGALAAISATTVTHPLDVIRVRIATQPELKGMAHTMGSMLKEGGPMTFYKGYVPTVLSLTPFIAINFATFDYMKTAYIHHFQVKKVDTLSTLGMGAASGLFAQTICYPLDTVRRRMQLKGSTYSSTLNAFQTILRNEGGGAFYLGMVPNALKIVPNNAVRFFISSAQPTEAARAGAGLAPAAPPRPPAFHSPVFDRFLARRLSSLTITCSSTELAALVKSTSSMVLAGINWSGLVQTRPEGSRKRRPSLALR